MLTKPLSSENASFSKLKLKLREVVFLNKRAIIATRLVEESAEKSNEEIEKEIIEELSRGSPPISWLKKVEKVTITEA